jgi:hypothetical protein
MVLIVEVPRYGVGASPLDQRFRLVSRAEWEAEERAKLAKWEKIRALLAADAEANARFLREYPHPHDVRGRAARLLARMSKRLGL